MVEGEGGLVRKMSGSQRRSSGSSGQPVPLGPLVLAGKGRTSFGGKTKALASAGMKDAWP